MADLRERDALHRLLPGPPHERAEQAGDQHDEIDLGAGVADAQLDGRHVGAGPDVEVDHPRIADRPRVDQVLDHRVVLGAGRHHRGRPRGRPTGPDQLAVARVAGVTAIPVGGAGRDGEQGGQMGGDAADDLHGLVAVRHVDMDLGAADVLLVDQHLVLVLHVREPRAGRDVAPVDVDQRHRARRHHTEAVRFGGLGQPGPQPLQVRPQLVKGVAHRRVRLHQRSLQLGCELRTVELAQERVDLGGGPPRLEVHDVELFLGPDLELPAAHGRDGRERVLRGGCQRVTGRGCGCTREAARLPLTSHLRVGVRPVVRGEWRLGALRRHRLGSEGCRPPSLPSAPMADDMYTVERSTTIDARPSASTSHYRGRELPQLAQLVAVGGPGPRPAARLLHEDHGFRQVHGRSTVDPSTPPR